MSHRARVMPCGHVVKSTTDTTDKDRVRPESSERAAVMRTPLLIVRSLKIPHIVTAVSLVSLAPMLPAGASEPEGEEPPIEEVAPPDVVLDEELLEEIPNEELPPEDVPPPGETPQGVPPPDETPPQDVPPPTEPPVADPPPTEPPVSDPPPADPPVSDPPPAEPPSSDPPVSDPPPAEPPSSDPPVSDPPPAELPSSDPPVIEPPSIAVTTPVAPAPSAPAVRDDPPPSPEVAVPTDEPPADVPGPSDPGLRAERYDGIYAQGVPVWVAMTATRELESGGNYGAVARGSTASGAYQVIDSTWNGYGGYARAVDAPPAVQDQFAYEAMVAILKRYGNEVSSIPVAWYFPVALGNDRLMDIVPVPQAGNILTPRQYQARWMAAFHRHLEAGSPVFLPADTDPLIPAIAFPVLGPTAFYDDWHAPRDGGARQHEGLDFMGVDGQPLRAAFDGVVTRIRPTNLGLPGVGITITREDGLRANYFHLDATLRWHQDLEIGDRVKAGQVIAFMGSTGNAGIPHLHFELRTADGVPIAPYPAVLEAIQREQCSVGIGPWSTEFSSPAEIAATIAAAVEAAAAAGIDLAALAQLFPPVVHEIEGPDDARWTAASDGAVTATGLGALIAPSQGKCENIPNEAFGTDAAGLGIDLLSEDWWGDDVDPEELAAMIAAVNAERSGEFEPHVVDAVVAMLASRLR
jgi:murein DD-endopeptidase MepM/ murein hydrolase activator NlpD